jgi:sulfatase maturation enzyme AslB (radical SAM superfamily)
VSRERELRQCAAAWEPGARLLGNVTAAEIIEVCDALTLEREHEQQRRECPHCSTCQACHEATAEELQRLEALASLELGRRGGGPA